MNIKEELNQGSINEIDNNTSSVIPNNVQKGITLLIIAIGYYLFVNILQAVGQLRFMGLEQPNSPIISILTTIISLVILSLFFIPLEKGKKWVRLLLLIYSILQLFGMVSIILLPIIDSYNISRLMPDDPTLQAHKILLENDFSKIPFLIKSAFGNICIIIATILFYTKSSRAWFNNLNNE